MWILKIYVILSIYLNTDICMKESTVFILSLLLLVLLKLVHKSRTKLKPTVSTMYNICCVKLIVSKFSSSGDLFIKMSCIEKYLKPIFRGNKSVTNCVE